MELYLKATIIVMACFAVILAVIAVCLNIYLSSLIRLEKKLIKIYEEEIDFLARTGGDKEGVDWNERL